MTLSQARRAYSLVVVLYKETEVSGCVVAPQGSIVRANRGWLPSTGFRVAFRDERPEVDPSTWTTPPRDARADSPEKPSIVASRLRWGAHTAE